MQLTVARAGFLTTVQDTGRAGFRELGVSPGGALDVHGMRVVNLLAGNPETAAGLEITSGNVRFQFPDSRVVAWVGGEYDVSATGLSVPAGRPALLHAQEELSFAGPSRGCRAWLAISGGLDVPVVLASRSSDVRAGFGGWHGRALRDGDVLPLGKNPALSAALIRSLQGARIAPWTAPFEWASPAERSPVLRIVRGNDWDRFTEASRRAFLSVKFVVSPESDRMGARLEGPLLERKNDTELVSEAVVPGTVQVPPGGRAILLLGDCQTVGGYPKLAHVITCDLPRAAQLCPGEQVWFCEVSMAEAHLLLSERTRALETFKIGLSLRR